MVDARDTDGACPGDDGEVTPEEEALLLRLMREMMPTVVGTDTGTDAERNGRAGSDDEQQAQDTPQQRAASRVWDASASAAPARMMARRGLLDICTALLEHFTMIGDGRMLEIAFGILRNLLCHPGLAAMLTSHAALPEATVRALCASDDPVALTGACNFLEDVCASLRHGAEGQQRWLSLLTGDDGAVVSHLVFIANNSLSDDLIAASLELLEAVLINTDAAAAQLLVRAGVIDAAKEVVAGHIRTLQQYQPSNGGIAPDNQLGKETGARRVSMHTGCTALRLLQNVAATVDGNRMLDMDGGLQELLGRLMVLTEDEATMGSIFGVLSALPGAVRTLVKDPKVVDALLGMMGNAALLEVSAQLDALTVARTAVMDRQLKVMEGPRCFRETYDALMQLPTQDDAELHVDMDMFLTDVQSLLEFTFAQTEEREDT